MLNCFYDIKVSSYSVYLRHDGDFSMSVYIAAPISILKFIHFEQYPLSQALSTEAIDCYSDSVTKWLI